MTKAEQILDKHIGFKTKMDLKKELVLEAMKEIAETAYDAGVKAMDERGVYVRAMTDFDDFVNEYFKP